MKPQCNSNKRRRNIPNVAKTATIAIISMSQMSSMAFTTTTIFTTSPSTAISRTPMFHTNSMTLFAASPANGDSPSNTDDDNKNLTMELVTDTNRHTLLNPPNSRPVLVDAFAPFCGPCKMLDKVLKKSHPRYDGKVDFCRWNVNDKENTVELKKFFIAQGYTLTKLPSLVLFREGEPIAVRPGFANEFQLDYWLEETLPDVLERTFDENGVKMVPLPSALRDEVEVEQVEQEKKKKATKKTDLKDVAKKESNKLDPMSAGEDLIGMIMEEREVWHNRTVVPATEGIFSA